jgi:Flp pilus assembly protein TadG
MSRLPVMTRIGRQFSRFAAAEQGNIAVIFALSLLPILGFVGAAVDYTQAVRARSSMQAAIDSTALMLSKDLTSGSITTSQITQKATDYFTGLYTDKGAPSTGITATYTAPTSTTAATIALNAGGSMPTQFIRVLSRLINTLNPTLSNSNMFDNINFNVTSTTTWGNVKMRVALALDNTGSMAQDGKITALRNAVAANGGLIDQLSALSKNDGDVYISVIPFAKVVNLDASSYTQSWIDWTDWLNPPTAQPANVPGNYQATLPYNWHAVGPGAKCPFTNTLSASTGNANGAFTCNQSPTSMSSASTIPSSGYICPGLDSNSHTKYNGCWTSEATGVSEIFCSGNTNCKCPKDANNNNVTGCSCTGSGSAKSCTGNTYVHNWTQPGPNDTSHNTNQPRVSAAVGFRDASHTPNKERIWTASATSVANDYQQASTNPINTWTGCIIDRTQPNDATGVGPSSSDVTTLFPANEYYSGTAYCSSSASTRLEPIIPLSYNWGALKTAVNAMQPTGSTNQAVGLAWAWQSLLQGAPLNAPAEDANTTYNRVIILLSDGLNTEDRWPSYGNGSNQASGNPIDVRQTALCTNLKNATDSHGTPLYTIYTIQVNTHTPADPESSVLKGCASSPDKFYQLKSSSEIITTFQTIGTALSKLRLAR